MITISKEIIKDTHTYCGCGCGCRIDQGIEVIKIESWYTTGPKSGTRILLKEHLLKWLNNDESRVMNFKFPPQEHSEVECPECIKTGIHSFMDKTILPSRPNDDFYKCPTCRNFEFVRRL